MTERVLALWTDIVRDEHRHEDQGEPRGWLITTVLFDHETQIGVAVGLPGHRRFAERYPAQDFTLDRLRAAVNNLGELSKRAPLDG